MNIALVGSGNTASVLGRRIRDAGHTIVQVYSRQLHNGEVLAGELECRATNNWSQITKDAHIYLIALADNALDDLHTYWQTPKGMVVHTAGSVTKDILKKVAKNYGVLYPLQSLRKEKMNYEVIPLLIDAVNADDLALLADFATSISPMVITAGDAYRMHIHLAAVVVNNFTNHLYALAEAYCSRTGTSFDLLRPLINETAERVRSFSPSVVQTGPAIRGDNNTLEKHAELLKDEPALLAVYELMTKSIQQGGRIE